MSLSDIASPAGDVANGLAFAQGPVLDESGFILPSEYPNSFAASTPDKTAMVFGVHSWT